MHLRWLLVLPVHLFSHDDSVCLGIRANEFGQRYGLPYIIVGKTFWYSHECSNYWGRKWERSLACLFSSVDFWVHGRCVLVYKSLLYCGTQTKCSVWIDYIIFCIVIQSWDLCVTLLPCAGTWALADWTDARSPLKTWLGGLYAEVEEALSTSTSSFAPYFAGGCFWLICSASSGLTNSGTYGSTMVVKHTTKILVKL